MIHIGSKTVIAGAMLLPYLAWVSYATLLNATILVMNR